MKVYELMERLAKAPAGLEVRVLQCVTASDFTDGIIENEVFEDGEELESEEIRSNVTGEIVDTDFGADFTIFCMAKEE